MSEREHGSWLYRLQKWWHQRPASKERQRQRSLERSKKRLDRVRSWPRAVRDALAIGTVMLAVGFVAVIVLLVEMETQNTVELLETQRVEEATFVEVVPSGRNGETYYVEFRGEEVRADYGWLIQDPRPGVVIEVVQDPDDSSRVVVVGTPEDWADSPQTFVTMGGIALVLGLIAAVVGGLTFVPERAEPVLEKVIDACGRFIRWLRGVG